MRHKYTPYILVAPLVLFLALTFVYALFYGVVQSLVSAQGAFLGRFTWQHYSVVLRDGDFWISLGATISVAVIATLISNVLGTLLAFAMLRAGAQGRSLQRALQLPVILPHLIVVIMVIHIFSQSGVLARLFWWGGLIDNPNQFPLLVYDRFAIGIMLVYLYKQVPFVAMLAYDTLRGISHKYADVAANLGASSWQTITQIYLPILRPTIIGTSLITFAYAFGAFEVPLLLGTPVWRTLPVESYLLYTNIDPLARTQAMVINVLISAISLALAGLYFGVERFIKRFQQGGGL